MNTENSTAAQRAQQILSYFRNASTQDPLVLGPGHPPFDGFFRMTYVTRNLDDVGERFFGLFGVSHYHVAESETIVLGENNSSVIKIASAWVGATLLELIEPLDDPSNYYVSLLPDSGQMAALHNLGRQYDSVEDLAAAAQALKGLKLVVEERGSGVSGFRADMRNVLGHYLECMSLTSKEREQMSQIPQGLLATPSPVLGPAPAPFPGFYQFTYVTDDLDSAIDFFKACFGINQFLEMKPLEIPLVNGERGQFDCALAYLGAVEIELLCPRGGAVDIYADQLSSRPFAIRHHHTSRLFVDYDEYERRNREFHDMGMPILADNNKGNPSVSRFYYVDSRQEIGHYLESTIFDDSTKIWTRSIPRQ